MSKRWVRACAWAVACVLVALAGAHAVRVVRRPPAVTVVVAQVEDVSRMLAVTGRIEAERVVRVSPQFPGRVTQLLRDEGDRVCAGEILARLEDISAVSAVREQQAMLASRRRELAQAMRDLGRTRRLAASGAIVATELETAQLVVTRARDDVARLSAILASGRAQLVLTAPFDGTIVRRDGQLGQVAGPTTALFELATLDATRVSAEVDERYVLALRPGMAAQILAVGTSTAPSAATISYVGQIIDPQTGAATVRFAYREAGPDEAARVIGMSVDVNVQVAFVRAAVTIPREAIGSDGGQRFALVVIDNRVERRVIEIEDWPAASVVVRSGLAAGERVIADPSAAVAGDRVRTTVHAGV